MLYREVANGGNGLVWYDEQFPLFGAHGGYPCPNLTNWSGTSPWGAGGTIGELVLHSGWQLHPCIAEALCSHPRCYVLCDQPPAGCIPIHLSGLGVIILDPMSGRLYTLAEEGTLSLEDNEMAPLCSLCFYKRSLEDLLEEFLRMLGCGFPAAASAQARTVPDTPSDLASATRPRELTPDDLDPGCATDPGIWHGLYRGLSDYLPDVQGRWEADDLSTSGQTGDEPLDSDS
jgi:hypothetical protein